MIKRIAVLFALTGSAHAFSIIALKYMTNKGYTGEVANVGEADSLIQLLIGLIGMGMQSDAIRNIALENDWKDHYKRAQTARVTMSILILILSIFWFPNPVYICFLLAPFIGSSGDYALYAKGFSIEGAFIALVRVVFPLAVAMVVIYLAPKYILLSYVLATGLIYLTTSFLIAVFLKVSYYFRPSLESLKIYVKTFSLGVLNLCFYFFGLGLLLLVQWLYDDKTIVISFLGLKLYMIYRGAIRVIHQGFVNRMTSDKVCLSIDQVTMLISIAFFGSVIIFPTSFISLFFGNQFLENKIFFMIIGFSSIVSAVFQSTSTRLILDKKDKIFMYCASASVMGSIIFLLLFRQFSDDVNLVALTLLFGEALLSFLVLIVFYDWSFASKRILFLVKSLTALLIPFAFKMMFTDDVLVYFSSFAVMGLLLIAVNYRNFNMKVTNTKIEAE